MALIERVIFELAALKAELARNNEHIVAINRIVKIGAILLGLNIVSQIIFFLVKQ